MLLVTGHYGFIGSNLINELTELGHSVVGLDSNYLHYPNWEQKLNDFLSQHNPTYIFHVGACSNTLVKDINYAFIRNYHSTKILTDWCSENNSKLIFSSTAACYGVNKNHPSNLYGWTKQCAEDYVIKQGGISLRYFNVYGPGESKKGAMASFIFQSYLRQLNEKPIKLFPGNPKRDFIYIADVVSSNITAFKNFQVLSGKIFEVGTGQSHTYEDILNILNYEFTYADISEIPQGYQKYTQSNAKNWLPDWKPQFDLVKGINSYLKSLALNGDD